MTIRILGALAFFGLIIGFNSAGLTSKSNASADKPLMVSHDVFFSLKDATAENKKTLNDLNFDVALHIVFNDKASQDKYQDAPRHLEFIEKNKSLWKSVRVFDSYVSK